MRYTFKAYERLKREQHIDALFHTGKALSVFPLKMLHTITTPEPDERSPVRAGFSVPKKKFRLSVHRHRITRLLREAWRLNKGQLYPAIPAGSQMHLFIIFTDNTMPDFPSIEKAMKKGIDKLMALAEEKGKENKQNE